MDEYIINEDKINLSKSMEIIQCCANNESNKYIKIDSSKKGFQTYIQWIAAFGAFILMLQIGIIIGWSSPNIIKLTANDSVVPLSNYQVSWVVSIASVGAFVGAPVGSVCVEFFGARRSLLMCFVFITVSWTCIVIADSVIWLYAARFFSGIGMAATYCCFAIYLGEIADPKIRGTLVSIAASGNPFGIVAGTIIETYLPMKVSGAIYLIVSLLGLTLFLWLRDSPYYWVKKEVYVQAKSSIDFYQANCDLNNQLKEIKGFVKKYAGRNFYDKLRHLNTPISRKALILVTTVFMLPHLSGFDIIEHYMEMVIRGTKSDLINSKQLVIYANITSIITILLTFKLIDILGRKILLIIASIGTAIAMLGLGVHFLLLKNGTDAENLQWLPLICIFEYVIMYAIGYSQVPSTVLSEVMADSIKSTGVCMAMMSAAAISFIVAKSFLPLVDIIGEVYVFFIHAVLSCITIPYALFLLPETKGKTFQQIQDDLSG